MLRQIVCFLFVALATTQDCSSITSLGHYTGDCPTSLGMPSCSYIQQNKNQICTNLIAATGISVNGPACNLNGAGCIYNPTMADITEYFCCTLVSPSATPSPSITPPPSPTPSVTPTVSITPSPSSTPIDIYDSQNDFNGIQGNNGWNYNYYQDPNTGQLEFYSSTERGFAWMYSQNCAGWISATTIMPNDAVSCSTTFCGTIKPAIKWTNPLPTTASSYYLVTLSLTHYENGGQGDQIWVNINGGSSVYSPLITYSSGTLTWSYYGNINIFELIVQPWQGCDYAHIDYRITIMSVPVTPSPTSTASRTSSASASRSAYPSATAGPTQTPSSSATSQQSSSVTRTSSASATATMTATSSATSSASATATMTATSSATSSVSATATMTSTATSTGTVTMSPTQSASATSTTSSAQTPSATSTVSVSPSVTSSPSPNWFKPPEIPQNLTNISSSEAIDYINTLAAYDPSVIQGSLNSLGNALLANAANGSVSIETSQFKMTLQALPQTNGTAVFASGTTNIAMPPLKSLVAGAAAASLIQWTKNPYTSVIPDQKPDAPVISFSVLDSDGKVLSVSNLSKPIIMSWNQNLGSDDPRIQIPPSYVVRCDTAAVYLTTGGAMIPFNKANRTRNDLWEVPCLMNSTNYIQCTSFQPYTFQPFECPAPSFDHSCIYWSTSLQEWSSDGCNPSYANLTYASCECTHLTDFSSRVLAAVASNKALFDNAINVYSAEGLKQDAEWFGLFGGIGLFTLIIAIVVIQVDLASTRRYVHSLLRNKFLREFLHRRPSSPLYIYDLRSTMDRFYKTMKQDALAASSTMFQRILQQHPSLQFIFRYDPRLSRVFRLLFLCIVQFHSLFITALLYGFTYGVAGGKVEMTMAETIFLALITMVLNIPVVQGLVRSMNHVGTLEFQAQFPVLHEEYQRRSEFEKVALVYLNKKDGMQLDPDFLAIKGVAELQELPTKELLRAMAAVISKPWKLLNFHMSCWKAWPAHTWSGAGFLLVAMGYLGFILNFLILFAANHDRNVGVEVMTSWGISQLSSILVIQPITIVLTFSFYWLVNRYSSYLPVFLKNFVIIPSVRSIPSVFYFSNPWSYASHSPLTAEYAYTIFTRCSAYASHSEELAYAPMGAIVTSLGSEKKVVIDESIEADEKTVKGLYVKFWQVYGELMH